MVPPNCILGLDNAKVHLTEEVEAQLRRINHVFLPPYSPDFTPIELLFGWMKIVMKQYYSSPEDIQVIVRRILQSCPQNKIEGFYREAARFWYSNEL